MQQKLLKQKTYWKKFDKWRYLPIFWNKQAITDSLFVSIKKHVNNPEEKVFVDLFWWWWSVSINAMNHFKKVIYNEINEDLIKWFIEIQNDNILNKLQEKRVSKEEFLRIKWKEIKTWEESIILSIRSYWYTRKWYVYWKETEKQKEIMFKILNSKTEKEYKKYIREFNKKKMWLIEKLWWKWIIYLDEDDWNVFKQQKDKRLYKFWKNWAFKRVFIKEFDKNLLKQKIDSIVNIYHKEKLKRLLKNNTKEKLNKLNDMYYFEWLKVFIHIQAIERFKKIQSIDIKKKQKNRNIQ